MRIFLKPPFSRVLLDNATLYLTSANVQNTFLRNKTILIEILFILI